MHDSQSLHFHGSVDHGQCFTQPDLVVNDPAWVRNSPEKIFVTEFADLMPKTLITTTTAQYTAAR